MRMPLRCLVSLVAITLASSLHAAEPSQYEFEGLKIAGASADEATRESFSVKHAADYLDGGAQAWFGARKCISCHTNGTYLLVRPSLTPQLGPPPKAVRDNFATALDALAALPREEMLKSTRPAQAIYAATGLVEWDKHVARSLSPESKRALALVCSLQLPTGTWGSLDCWPPYESDAYHLATVAAIAVADAPGWLGQASPAERQAVDRLRAYLRTQPPPHDYGSVLLLWASSRMDGLLEPARKQAIIEMIGKQQRPDGGWSIRTFAKPEAWGGGNRAEKLRKEADFDRPASDGHQTGMAIVALREAGVPAGDPQIVRGVEWLKRNQRASGRWWTRSLNTDRQHYITYSGTAFPLLALSLCDALPKSVAEK